MASRIPFLLAVALVAAGLGDPIVESVSNTGIFGGHYADNNHLGVIPTLFAGAIVALEMLALRFVEVVRRSVHGSGDTLIDVAKDLATRSFARDFPLILALQLGSLFALESFEAIVTGGRALDGTAWLGGPVLFSLIAHAIVGAVCTLALGAFMRAIVRAFASIVLTAAKFIWLAMTNAARSAFRLGRHAALCARAQAPHVSEIGGRAPPLLQALA